MTLVGANAPGGLASRPVRVVFCDEVDRYPASAGTEGDPVNLAIARTKTFWNRRVILASTPGDEETSRINKAWLASDMRRYFVPCGACGHRQFLKWSSVTWTDEDPATAAYGCDECGSLWTDGQRLDALQRGEWIAERPEVRISGFHLNELYSPFRKLREIVADFLASKGAPETLKTWVNTSLGEVWRDQQGEKLDSDSIAARCENYTDAPEPVVIVTMTVDVQDDRLEVEMVGWGEGEESWGLDHVVLRGDPGQPELWARLDDQLGRMFRRVDGAVLSIAGCAIDSAGHYTKQVYAWSHRHKNRVYAIVGRAGKGRALVAASKRAMKAGDIRLYVVGTDTAKELLLFSRLRIKEPGPGYCHWPTERYPTDYFDQLTSERRVVRYSHGHPTHVWGAAEREAKRRARSTRLRDCPDCPAATEFRRACRAHEARRSSTRINAPRTPRRPQQLPE